MVTSHAHLQLNGATCNGSVAPDTAWVKHNITCRLLCGDHKQYVPLQSALLESEWWLFMSVWTGLYCQFISPRMEGGRDEWRGLEFSVQRRPCICAVSTFCMIDEEHRDKVFPVNCFCCYLFCTLHFWFCIYCEKLLAHYTAVFMNVCSLSYLQRLFFLVYLCLCQRCVFDLAPQVS